MALVTNELMSEVVRGPLKRFQVYENGQSCKTFANKSGAPLLAQLTPVVIEPSGADAGQWRAWQDADPAVHGFTVDVDGVQVDATGEVQGNVMTRGMVVLDDIALPAGQTLATLKTALKTGLRELGIDIQGLPGSDQPSA